MRFNPRARLDTRRIGDAGRGRAGGRGGGAPARIPGGLPVGGGIGGVVVLVVVFLAVQLLGGGGSGPGPSSSAMDVSRLGDADRYAGCETGADANESADCLRVGVENSLHDYWSEELGPQFRPIAGLVTFTDSVQTGCGGATAAVGPHYCPPDERIYLDTRFFDEVLERRLGGPDGGFVEPYVLAHEYGHHVQSLLGTMGRVRTQQGPQSDAVRLELQADCYAGMWARSATSTEDAGGAALVEDLTRADVEQALAAAAAVGDDRIQQRAQGQVTEESWTHGSAEARMRWFRTGFEDGSREACDTFAAPRV